MIHTQFAKSSGHQRQGSGCFLKRNEKTTKKAVLFLNPFDQHKRKLLLVCPLPLLSCYYKIHNYGNPLQCDFFSYSLLHFIVQRYLDFEKVSGAEDFYCFDKTEFLSCAKCQNEAISEWKMLTRSAIMTYEKRKYLKAETHKRLLVFKENIL